MYACASVLRSMFVSRIGIQFEMGTPTWPTAWEPPVGLVPALEIAEAAACMHAGMYGGHGVE